MPNSFIENVNYLAKLDNAFGDSASFTKTNISFRGSSADVKFSMSYYDNTDMKIKSVDTLMQDALYSDLTDILTQFKNSIELISGFTCLFTISNDNNAYLVSSINFSITSSDSEKKITQINFNMTKNGIELYDTYGKINNPIKILPNLALYDDIMKSSIININTFKDEILNVNSNIISINTVSDSISHIITVSNNIDIVNSVATNIVPNLAEILQANTSASIATIQADLATTKANESLISAANASTSESNVQAMKLAVETIYDSFDDRFLGAFDFDPVVDNDGNPLLNGALYFNSSSNTLKVYSTGTAIWYNIPQIYLSSLLDVELTSISVGQILVWNGAKWTNSVITVGSGGYAANVYLTNLASATNGSYKQVSYVPDISETVINTVVNNNEVLSYAGIFDGDIKSNAIPPGEWGFHFHRYVDNTGQTSRLRFEIFKRSSAGIDTSLFSIYSNDINDSVSTREDILITQPTYSVIDTDRIGIKIYASTNRTSDTIVSFKIGNGEATFFNTPLQIRHNQLRARDEVDSHPSSSISVIPSGSLIDTDVQNALVNIYEKTSNIDNTSDSTKNVLSATKLTTARNIALNGDITGNINFDGSEDISIHTTISANSVALGTDTTGNYMVDITAGSGISVSHIQGEGSTATIINSAPNITTDITTTHNSANVIVNSSDGTDGTINSATQTLAGVMSAADKTKLDEIENGATGDQTASEILTLLKTVDGIGSGVDADLLDGQEGSYYLNASNINTGIINDSYLPNTITSDITGNAATATKLATARTISLTGDVTGNVSFDGSVNVSITATVADDSHNHVISNVDGLQAALDSKANQTTTYTKTEVDNALSLKADDTEIASVNLLRADKYLAAQNVVNMAYNIEGKLSKVQYNNATDVDYEVLTYNVDGKLTNVAHYVGSVLKGNTVLSYVGGKLVSAPFTAV